MRTITRAAVRAGLAEPGRALALAVLIAVAVAMYGGVYAGLTRVADTAAATTAQLGPWDLALRLERPVTQPPALTLPEGSLAAWRLAGTGRLSQGERPPVPAWFVTVPAQDLAQVRITAGQPLSDQDPTGVLVDQTYAARAGLAVGDPVGLSVGGARVAAVVRGWMIHGEFLVPVLPEAVHLPIPGVAAAVAVPDALVAALGPGLGMDPLTRMLMGAGGAPRNQLLWRLPPGVDRDAAAAAAVAQLSAAGLSATALLGEEQAGTAWIAQRLTALRDFLPTVVAIFVGLVFVVEVLFVQRLIAASRKELATWLALGYAPRRILGAWMIGLGLGPLLGVGLGVLGALGVAHVVGQGWLDGTGFPLLDAPLPWTPIATGAGLALAGALPAIAWPLLRALRELPADLYAPPLDRDRPGPLVRALALLDGRLALPTRLGLRNLARRPDRTLAVGVCALGAMVLASSLGVFDAATREVLEDWFDHQRWDLMVVLDRPQDPAALAALVDARWEAARVVPATVFGPGGARAAQIIAGPLPGALREASVTLGRLPERADELVLDHRLSEALGLRLGGSVRVEGPAGSAELRLVGETNNIDINQGLIPTAALAGLVADPGAFNQVYVATDTPDQTWAALARTPGVGLILPRAPVVAAVRAMTLQFVVMLRIGAALATLAGVSVGVALVILGLRERAGEQALLLGLGLDPRRVVIPAAWEVVVVSLGAMGLGLPIVRVLCSIFQARLATVSFLVDTPFQPLTWLLWMTPTALALGLAVPMALRRARQAEISAVLQGR